MITFNLFTQTLAAWQAEKSQVTISKGRHISTIVIAAAWAGMFAAPGVYANPEGGRVVEGDATIDPVVDGYMNINQHTRSSVIDWDSFSIASGEHVNFQQPDVTSTALNRVTGGSLSEIFGQLTANGIVLIVNPNGVVFSETSRIDVGGLVATTANITNENFMSGNFLFERVPGSESSRIVNHGQITAAEGGLVALVAPGVANSGVIGARLGRITLAAGDQFTVDFYGDQLITFATDSQMLGQLYGADGQPVSLVSNSGEISADGGVVYMMASDAVNLLNNAISMTGIVEADTVQQQGGEIVLSAGTGSVNVSGSLAASGNDVGGFGGSVTVLGDEITLASSAVVDVSGDTGGGDVKIGGDFSGEGDLQSSTSTTVAAGAVINADAVTSGDGGTIVIWADGETYYAGAISAVGGSDAGNGGFVEVSGKARLVFDGAVDATAANGIGGTLLLDPTDVVIEAGVGDDISEGSSISADAINAMLRAGMTVEIDADNNITVNQQIDGRPIRGQGEVGAGLTLDAGNTVLIFQPIITNDGAIVVNAGAGGIEISGNAFLAVAMDVFGAGSANITLNAGGDIEATNLMSLGVITLTSASGAVRVEGGLFGLDADGDPLTPEGVGIGSLNIVAAGDVELSGAEATDGDININAGGSVTNDTFSLIASGSAIIASNGGAIVISGDGSSTDAVVEAEGSVNITTTGAVELVGDVMAGADIDIGDNVTSVASLTAGTLEAANDVAVISAGAVTVGDIGAGPTNAVQITAGGNLTTGSIFGLDGDDNPATPGPGVGSIDLTTTNGTVTLVGGSTSAGSGGDITVNATVGINSSGVLNSDGAVTLSSDAGTVNVGGAGTVIDAAGDVDIDTAGGDVTVAGDVLSGGAIAIGAGGAEVASLTAGDLSAATNVSVDSNGLVTVGDVLAVTNGAVRVNAGGAITVGNIFGQDSDSDGEGEGVGSIDLTTLNGTVTLAGGSTSIGNGGSINISATSGINSTNVLVSDGAVSLDGGTGDITVSGSGTVIDVTGNVDIDSAGGVVTLGNVRSTGGSVLIGATGAEVGSLIAGNINAADDLTVDSNGAVTTDELVAGEDALDILRIDAGGTVTVGQIGGSPDNFDGTGVGTGAYRVDIQSTGGDIITNGIDAGAGGVELNAGANNIEIHGAIQSGGDVLIGDSVALAGAACVGDPLLCPQVDLNHNIYTEGGSVTFDADVTIFEGFTRVPTLDDVPVAIGDQPAGGEVLGTTVVDVNGNPIADDLFDPVDIDELALDGTDPLSGCSDGSFDPAACDAMANSADPNSLILCTMTGNCPNTLNTFGDLFRYTQNEYFLVNSGDTDVTSGSQISIGTNFPDIRVIDGTVTEVDHNDSNSLDVATYGAGNGRPGKDSTVEAENRENAMADLLGSATITIDTTQGGVVAGGADITFNGTVGRYEGDASSIDDPADIPGAVNQDTIVLPTYVNHTLVVNGGDNGSVYFATAVGSSSDHALGLTLGNLDGSLAVPSEGIRDLWLGTFDLVVEGALAPLFENAGLVRLNDIDHANPPAGVTQYPITVNYEYIGTQTNRAGPNADGNSYSGTPTFNVGSGTPGAGSNVGGGAGGAGTGVGGGSGGVGGIPGPGGNGSGSDPGDPTTGAGGTLGAPTGGDNPNNLNETQKQQGEDGESSDSEQEEDTCPRGPGRHTDLGVVPSELGAEGNVFTKCEDDFVASSD